MSRRLEPPLCACPRPTITAKGEWFGGGHATTCRLRAILDPAYGQGPQGVAA